MFHSGRLARYIYMRCCGGNGADVSHPRLLAAALSSAPPSPLRGHMYFPQGATDRHRTYNSGNNGGYRWPRDVWDYRFLRVKPSRPDVNVLRGGPGERRAGSEPGDHPPALTLHARRARAPSPRACSSRSRHCRARAIIDAADYDLRGARARSCSRSVRDDGPPPPPPPLPGGIPRSPARPRRNFFTLRECCRYIFGRASRVASQTRRIL